MAVRAASSECHQTREALVSGRPQCESLVVASVLHGEVAEASPAGDDNGGPASRFGQSRDRPRLLFAPSGSRRAESATTAEGAAEALVLRRAAYAQESPPRGRQRRCRGAASVLRRPCRGVADQERSEMRLVASTGRPLTAFVFAGGASLGALQ